MNTQSILLALALSLVITACEQPQIRKVSDLSAGEISQKSLLAFSIDDIAPFDKVEFDIVVADLGDEYSPLGHIAVDRKGGAGQLLVYELPPDTVQFGLARFRYAGDWWETVAEGPEVPTAPGTLTYIGKFQIQSVREGVYHDSGRRYPARVSIVIRDASETDMQELATRYPSMAHRLVKSVSSEVSEEYGRGSLRFVSRQARAGRRQIDFFERTVEPTEFPPRPAPRRDQGDRGG